MANLQAKWLIVSCAPFTLHFCPHRCWSHQISWITCVLRKKLLVIMVMLLSRLMRVFCQQISNWCRPVLTYRPIDWRHQWLTDCCLTALCPELPTQLSRYHKGKTNLDFTGARHSECQWHQLGHMQVCTSLQTDNHASTSILSFLTGRMPFLPPNRQCQSSEVNKLLIMYGILLRQLFFAVAVVYVDHRIFLYGLRKQLCRVN